MKYKFTNLIARVLIYNPQNPPFPFPPFQHGENKDAVVSYSCKFILIGVLRVCNWNNTL